MTSVHYRSERAYRERRIREIGYGKIYAEFIVDKGHEKGAEKHVLTTTGIIIIYNAASEKMVTKLIARPGQVKRYFSNEAEIPGEIVELARQHQKEKINY